jgi:hypothetical protein
MKAAQHGEDRAKYGDNLLNRLAKDINRKGFDPSRLRKVVEWQPKSMCFAPESILFTGCRIICG